MDAYIGLGGNMGDTITTLHGALDAINKHPQMTLITHSSFYGSQAVGVTEQADFINAVAHINTSLKPLELLKALQAIENDFLRRREQRWGPRTLDLDLLLYNNEYINLPTLTVPHPRMTKRSFVIFPLAEIAEGLIFPNGLELSHYQSNINNDCWILEKHND
ncbi:MAG: 2-amino-4-hydroxy-6-hydroxymethyldihydropteridine diphosphokinase [Thiotrichaceae bacterium]|nr:2-amino-4-hydroxy-6-hydroxymethyldihydropteridine diphosphokinase [Thiotrichaceae bacterium]